MINYHGNKYICRGIDGFSRGGTHAEGQEAPHHPDNGLHDSQVVHDVDKREEENDYRQNL